MSILDPRAAEQPAIVDEQEGVRCVLPSLTCQLPGGLVGHYQRDRYDCQRAAVATVLQVDDYFDVPALHGPGEHDRLREFLAERGYWVRHHHPGAPGLPGNQWPPIGLWISCSSVIGPAGERHACVCLYREQIFDPASGWVWEDGCVAPQLPVEFGMSLIPKEGWSQ